jgi:hypothetical protein
MPFGISLWLIYPEDTTILLISIIQKRYPIQTTFIIIEEGEHNHIRVNMIMQEQKIVGVYIRAFGAPSFSARTRLPAMAVYKTSDDIETLSFPWEHRASHCNKTNIDPTNLYI